MEDAKIRILLECEKEVTKNLTPSEKYKYFLGRMQYLKYESGKENFMRSDCSGSVCLALLMATGYSIRVTAEDLYRKYFTIKNPDKDTIQAAFIVTHYDRQFGARKYKAGEVCHVAGICGKGVVLNCVEPRAYLRDLHDMTAYYHANDYTVHIRGLDMEALKKASEEKRDLFGADAEFMELKEAITEEK